jgi:hypothetical protein
MSEENEEHAGLPLQPKHGKVEFVVPDRDNTLFTTYSNNVQIGWTAFDLRMLFGEVVDAQPDKIVVEQRAQITVSYLQAKLLTVLLTQAIQRHESVHGEVKVPAEMVAFDVRNAEAKVAPGASARNQKT